MGPPGVPGGLLSATDYGGAAGGRLIPFENGGEPRKGWTLEIRFPLRSGGSGAARHGGLLDAGAGLDYSAHDPNLGGRYWWLDFSRTTHPMLTVGAEALQTDLFIGPEFARPTSTPSEFVREQGACPSSTAPAPPAPPAPIPTERVAEMCAQTKRDWLESR